tara:strand:+ start:8032 stop:8481 length:450 start_codon:yes stop_codon:yes gene_type:complete
MEKKEELFITQTPHSLKDDYKWIIGVICIIVLGFLLDNFFNLKTIVFLVGVMLSSLIYRYAHKKQAEVHNIPEDLVDWIHELITTEDERNRHRCYFYIYDNLRERTLLNVNEDHKDVLLLLKKYQPPKHIPMESNMSMDHLHGISLSFR